MAKGYFLRVGDKTTCGGEVLSGHSNAFLRGAELPREGSLVSCGKNPGMTYRIISGPGKIRVGGMPLAGTLDSVSSCPCGATFISSIPDGYGKEPASVTQRKSVAPIDISLFNPSQAIVPQQYAQSAKRKPREITLTIGVFFDGTGNNADNSADRQNACAGEHFGMSDGDAESALTQCVRLKRSHSGIAAGSYLGYYTNVYWLNRLYKQKITADTGYGQSAIYIEGIGTESGQGDSAYGMGTGRGNTGVLSKTDKAVALLVEGIQDYLFRFTEANDCIIKELQFDIFGFSRGAAAARHFANRVFDQDDAIVAAIKAGLGEVKFNGSPGGKTRFLGIFDTVAGIGTPVNGFNPHSADTGEVNIVLRPGVAEKVFHITAQHECRFNFALNSVKPAWPELALPGAHSDIGGGYNPDEYEACFLTRPQFETVPVSVSDKETKTYRHARAVFSTLQHFPAIAPLLQGNTIKLRAWHDDRMPADRYGTLQKRSGAALTLERPTRNDWSKVALRVMIDAAQDAGVVFEPILLKDDNLSLPAELISLCEKAIIMGRATRNGQWASGPADLPPRKLMHWPENTFTARPTGTA
ncbi:phospholipase effector Tle1 domain-containing protein [Erwinia sp. AnSW2-5]|uniref:phospholipase effector Tle1 domain-containing protein n=1 Tax=Erwinia sp. AnSW2-5 TaxID=3367692 RepID=UPI00385F2091